MSTDDYEEDITRLSVPQVILLTLLVTTITSVATAIVVVQLMQGMAGDTIFQTIERVSERVVESQDVAATQRTIVIKEGDLVAKAIQKHNNHILELYEEGDEGEVVSLGYAILIEDNNLVSAPKSLPQNRVIATSKEVAAHGVDEVMLWSASNAGTVFEWLSPAVVEDVDLHLGQTLVYFGGDGSLVRGLVAGVSDMQLEFSDSLDNKDVGLMIELGGRIVGIWTGQVILRKQALEQQVEELKIRTPYNAVSNNVASSTTVQASSSSFTTNPDGITFTEKQEGCSLLGGSLNEHSECEEIDQSACLVLGGTWEGCGSPCRHSSQEGIICPALCHAYCKI